MKIICDTNIFLDVLLKQAPFAIDSAKILLFAKSETWDIYLPASSVTDIFFIVASRTHSREKAYHAVGEVLSMAKFCPITEKEVRIAYQRHTQDFEDCLIAVCAELLGADAIITRDKKGFLACSLPIMTPTEFLKEMDIRGICP